MGMSTFSSATGSYGLTAFATPQKHGTRVGSEVGVANASIALPTNAMTYCVKAFLANSGDDLTLNLFDGTVTATTTGVRQKNTATGVGTITGSGNALVTVTGSRIAGSPLTFPVAVEVGEIPAAWIIKVKDAAKLQTAITDVYLPGSSGSGFYLEELLPRENDATLNIAIANGTCTGITEDATSTNTTAGVGGLALLDDTGDGNDNEGIEIGQLDSICGIVIECIADTIQVVDNSGNVVDEMTPISATQPSIFSKLGTELNFQGATLTFTATNGEAYVGITIAGVRTNA